MKLSNKVINDVADEMVDRNHHDAAEARQWLKTQLKKLPPGAVTTMGSVLWAGGLAFEDDGYCDHEAELIWRHNQNVALSILRHETGVGEEGNPLHAGLHLSSKCPFCEQEELQRN